MFAPNVHPGSSTQTVGDLVGLEVGGVMVGRAVGDGVGLEVGGGDGAFEKLSVGLELG